MYFETKSSLFNKNQFSKCMGNKSLDNYLAEIATTKKSISKVLTGHKCQPRYILQCRGRTFKNGNTTAEIIIII